jgi:hypothetical protein
MACTVQKTCSRCQDVLVNHGTETVATMDTSLAVGLSSGLD